MNGYVLASIAGVAIGLAFALESKLIEQLGNVQTMYLYRWINAVLAVPLFFIAKDVRPLAKAKGSVALLVVEAVLYMVAGYAMLCAMRKIPAARAGAFEISYPLFTAIFCAVFFGQKLTPGFYVGALIMAIGAAIVVWSDGVNK